MSLGESEVSLGCIGMVIPVLGCVLGDFWSILGEFLQNDVPLTLTFLSDYNACLTLSEL